MCVCIVFSIVLFFSLSQYLKTFSDFVKVIIISLNPGQNNMVKKSQLYVRKSSYSWPTPTQPVLVPKGKTLPPACSVVIPSFSLLLTMY